MRVVAAPIDFPYRQPVTDHSQLAKDDALQPLDLLARAALAHVELASFVVAATVAAIGSRAQDRILRRS